ncbi:MAG: phosphotransferase [Candidatus Pacebacteria bacterium]|nr:phosphotransferase [Candidatus Paceibacterota bacterium]
MRHTVEHPPTPDEQKNIICKVFEFFSIGTPKDFLALTGGIANINWLVTNKVGDKFVVKFLVVQKKELLVNDIAIQEQLAHAGIKTVEYLRSHSGEYTYDADGITVVISKNIEGVHIEKITREFCENIGKILAIFHTSVKKLPVSHRGWLNAQTAKEYVRRTDSSLLAKAATHLVQENIGIFDMSIENGIIHGDVFESNVLAKSQTDPTIVALMDFEESEENLYIVDLARAMIGVCVNANTARLDPELILAVIQGYESVRKLTFIEKKNLRRAIQYTAGAGALWLHAHGFDEYAQAYIERVRDV